MKDETIIIRGQKYKLVPIENDWQITCITPMDMPLCYLGHNGKNLPAKHKVHEVCVGSLENIFKVGDQTKDGEILEFTLREGYLQAIVGTGTKRIDIDHLKRE